LKAAFGNSERSSVVAETIGDVCSGLFDGSDHLRRCLAPDNSELMVVSDDFENIDDFVHFDGSFADFHMNVVVYLNIDDYLNADDCLNQNYH
jgi:hypothetical protein